MIVGLCVAKNEADIIEAMVRHNLAFLDCLHIIDNVSSDGTPGILRVLGTDYPGRLTWSTDDRSGHVQKNIVNEALPTLLPGANIGHVVLLDADEMIRADPDTFKQTLLDTAVPVLLPWVTYVPTISDGPEPNPILRIRQRRHQEIPQYFKVTVPGRLIGHVAVQAGSHLLKGRNLPLPVELPGLSLAHFPVRSREQLMSKILIGSWAIRSRGPIKRKEAYHWHELAARIMSGAMIDDAELQSIASNYAAEEEVDLICDPLPDLCGPLRYTQNQSDLLVRNLIAYAESCVAWREDMRREALPQA